MSKLITQRHLILYLIVLIVLLSLVGIMQAALIPVAEVNLNEVGQAYEVFKDANGLLWISDYGAGEIWQVDPINRTYTIYGHLSGVADAKVDASGDLWWADNKNNELGHLVLGQLKADMWPLIGTVTNTLGIAFDPGGAVWTTDEFAPTIHRLQPATEEMCAYTIPDNGASSYIVANSDLIWIGDWVNNRIVALDPIEAEFEIFHLPEGNNPNIYGLSTDPENNIWWTDQSQNFLGKLNPMERIVTTYTIPLSLFGPTSVSSDREWLWTSGWGSGFVARLSPQNANGKSASITSTISTATADCVLPATSNQTNVTVNGPNPYSWTGAFYNRVFNFDGWHIYEIYTTDGSFGMPWGIVASGEDVFIVDQGRQKLTQLKTCFELRLSHLGDGSNPTSSTDTLPCPAGEYLPGTLVEVVAHPASNSGVVKWLGTNPGQEPLLTNFVTMPADSHDVTVVYGPNTYLPLLVRD